MYETSDIKKNLKVLIDGQPCAVVWHQFVKPGKGQAFTRTKLKNMITGNTMDRTFKSGEKLEPADLEERTMQYLYKDGNGRVFMDTGTYDQITLTDEQLGETALFLLDGTEVSVLFFGGKSIGVTSLNFVVLLVTEIESGFKGDTSSNTIKSVICEIGFTVNVLFFVEEGDKFKIDTCTGDYVECSKG